MMSEEKKLNIEIKHILLFMCLIIQSCSLGGSKSFIKPDEIAYEDVIGFKQQDHYFYEWSKLSFKNASEPSVPSSIQAPTGLRIRWLGTAGYEISDDSTTILIDPFVSRPSPLKLLAKIKIDTAAVDRYILKPMQQDNLEAILISHAHHDHFQDVPFIMAQYPDNSKRPLLIGGQNAFALLKGYNDRCGIEWVESIGGLHDSRKKIIEFDRGKACLSDSLRPGCEVGRFGNFRISFRFGSYKL